MKILSSIGVLLIASMMMVQGLALEAAPAIMVIEGNYAWVCFPPSREMLVCAKVHRNQFCLTEVVEPGVLRCFGPMMADE